MTLSSRIHFLKNATIFFIMILNSLRYTRFLVVATKTAHTTLFGGEGWWGWASPCLLPIFSFIKKLDYPKKTHEEDFTLVIVIALQASLLTPFSFWWKIETWIVWNRNKWFSDTYFTHQDQDTQNIDIRLHLKLVWIVIKKRHNVTEKKRS